MTINLRECRCRGVIVEIELVLGNTTYICLWKISISALDPGELVNRGYTSIKVTVLSIPIADPTPVIERHDMAFQIIFGAGLCYIAHDLETSLSKRDKDER